MKAILLKNFGDKDQLHIDTISKPKPKPDEVLVKVRAFSINPVDVKTRKGEALANSLQHEMPLILGWDISGVIEEIGNNVTHFTRGTAVFGMINFVGHGKAYAEYVTVPAHQLAIKPKNISHAEAAASCLAALTAWQAFTYFGKLQKKDKVLIHAAAGGVGHFAVQMATYLAASVIGTSSAKNRDFVVSLGAQQHIDYKIQKFENELTNIDFVLETIGALNFKKSVQVLKKGGTIVNLPSGLTESDKKAAQDKDLKACFFMSVFSSGKDMQKIAYLLQHKIVTPYIFRSYSFSEIREAHLQMESGSTKGKIVVEI